MMDGVLSDVLPYLLCPLCGTDLELGAGSVRCASGHSFDVARQGYVNLLPGGAQAGTADTPAMVADRAAFLSAGHFGSLAGLLAEHVTTVTGGGGMVLDAGAGTGYYLAAVLDQSPESVGAAFDVSKFAARRAARAHSRIGSVVCDLWRDLPIRSEAACAVLNVFAPRNPAEYRRVLRSDGGLFLVAPAPGHLRELIRPLGLLSVSDEKIQQVDDLLGRHFELISRQDHEIALLLPATAVQTLACMGPSAWHLTAAHVRERLAGMADPLPVTASFTLSVYRPGRRQRSSGV